MKVLIILSVLITISIGKPKKYLIETVSNTEDHPKPDYGNYKDSGDYGNYEYSGDYGDYVISGHSGDYGDYEDYGDYVIDDTNFENSDKDDNNKLSIDELKTFVINNESKAKDPIEDEKVIEEKVKTYVRAVDTDGDNMVSKDEALEGERANNPEEALEPLFRAIDINHDYILSSKELLKEASVYGKESIMAAINKEKNNLDTNKDGKLEMDEFKQIKLKMEQ